MTYPDPYTALAAVPEHDVPADHARARAMEGKRPHRGERPQRQRAHALGRSLVVPGPRTVARLLVVPLLQEHRDVWQHDGHLLVRPRHDQTAPPQTLTVTALAERLRALLSRLPDLDGEGRPYADLRTWAVLDQRSARDYLHDVALQTRVLTPRREPGPTAGRSPRSAKTPAEHTTAYRARLRLQEAESAEYAARLWAAEHIGERVPAAEAVAAVREQAAHWVAEFEDYTAAEMTEERAEDPSLPERFRVPGQRMTYAALDRLLGRRKVRGRSYYLVLATSDGA